MIIYDYIAIAYFEPFFHDEVAHLIPWKIAGPRTIYVILLPKLGFFIFLSISLLLQYCSYNLITFLPREWSLSNTYMLPPSNT